MKTAAKPMAGDKTSARKAVEPAAPAKAPATLVEPLAGARQAAPRQQPGSGLAPPKSARGERRREAILDAATAEFLQKGYQGASLRAIMAVAGGSARTLYQHFGDKAGLFRAIVARLEAQATMGLVPDGESDRPIDAELFDIGIANITSLLDPTHLAFFRLMVSESAAGSDLPTMVWNATHNLAVAKLADYLRVKGPRAGYCFEDPELAALQFLEASKSALHLETLFGAPKPSPEELSRRVRLAVGIFLHGTPPRPDGQPVPA